jgi:hypothetical protein
VPHGPDMTTGPSSDPSRTDAGEATYAVLVRPGEEILVGNGRRFRVVDVVPFDEEDESPFVGLLQVQTA